MTKIVIRFTFVEIYLLFWFMRKLFAWIGITDLKAAGVIPLGEGEKDPGLGPIANLLSEWADRYDSVYLISNQGYTGFQAYQDWLLKKTGKDVVGCLCALEGGDVTNHALIHAEVKRVLDKYGKTGELSFHISPGTPAMATIWVIMATSFYPATLVETDRNSGPRIVNFPFDVQARWVGEEAERQAQDLAITLVKEGAQKLSSLSDGATEENFAFKDMIYRCSAMVRVVERSKRVAVRDVPVLILGETGTGKELLANAIHMESLRSKNKFVEVNCGAIPSELVESEFFGHKKGAFTGALSNKDRQGHFEVANGGTLFLDEIGELPLNVQVKLLRVLQEKEVTPVGASESIKVDIRIIAATHRDLAEMVREGRFREDLYHRLAIGVADELHIQMRSQHFQCRLVVHGHGMALRGSTEQAIERAGIQHMKAESLRDTVGDGALARAAGAVDGDHRNRDGTRAFLDFCTHVHASVCCEAERSLAWILRPQRLASPMKSGKLVATLAQSRITMGPAARRPAMENDMAMR